MEQLECESNSLEQPRLEERQCKIGSKKKIKFIWLIATLRDKLH